MTRNSRRLQKAVQAIFNDYREKASCPGQVYQNAACGCENALQMWRGPKGDKGDQGPQGPKGDNAGSFLVNAEFVVDPVGQEPGAYLKLVLIDVAQQEQVVYVDLSYLTDIYTGGNGISITDMVVAARLGAGLTFDANGNIASAYQFCDGLDETSNVVKVRLDSSNHILGFASGTCGGLTASVGLAPSATGTNLVLTGADGTVLSTVPLNGSDGITVQKNAQTGGFTWLADPAGLVSSDSGNQLSVSQTDNKLYVGGNTLSYTFGTGAFTLKDSSGATLSTVTVPSAVRMLEDMELRTDDGVYLHLTYLRDNGLRAYQDVSLGVLSSSIADVSASFECRAVAQSIAPAFSIQICDYWDDGESDGCYSSDYLNDTLDFSMLSGVEQKLGTLSLANNTPDNPVVSFGMGDAINSQTPLTLARRELLVSGDASSLYGSGASNISVSSLAVGDSLAFTFYNISVTEYNGTYYTGRTIALDAPTQTVELSSEVLGTFTISARVVREPDVDGKFTVSFYATATLADASTSTVPTLMLTTTDVSGTTHEQEIDMSCILDIVDDKFGDLSPVAMSGSFNDLTDTPTNHVTTDTNQDITGTKTFVGQKKIAFKQSTANDKLGFTLFDRNGDEVGYLEYNPSSSGKVNNTPVMTLGNYATKAAERSYIGFRRYSSISGASGAYNLLTPLIVDARTPFNLTTTYTNFYLLLGVSDGTNMYTVGSNGVLDLSAMIPTGIAHLAGAETFTGSKTFGAGVYGNAVAMAAGAIDVSAGTVFTKTITANTTISFSNVPAAPATACVTLILTNGGSKTVTWPSSVKWSGGTAPNLTASGVDVLTFLTVNGGTTWYGTVNSLGAA